jgi:hypothetical protein
MRCVYVRLEGADRAAGWRAGRVGPGGGDHRLEPRGRTGPGVLRR